MLLRQWQGLRRILVIHPGESHEVARLKAAMRQLQRVMPQAEVKVLCTLSASRRALALPSVTEVLVHRAFSDCGLAGQGEMLLNLIEILRSEQFEAAFLFPHDRKSPYPLGYLCYLAEIPIRVGQSSEFGGGVLSHCVKETACEGEHDAELDASQRHLAFLNALGLTEAA